MLNIEHLTKTYGEKKAVDDLNLHIRPGEIYGFIGHNGAGKTTTLRSFAGIQQFDKGEIFIAGHICLRIGSDSSSSPPPSRGGQTRRGSPRTRRPPYPS